MCVNYKLKVVLSINQFKTTQTSWRLKEGAVMLLINRDVIIGRAEE